MGGIMKTENYISCGRAASPSSSILQWNRHWCTNDSKRSTKLHQRARSGYLAEGYDDETIQIDAHIKGQLVSSIVVDSGSDVNIITEHLCRTLGLSGWESAPLLLRMADQRLVRPLGMLPCVPINIGGVWTSTSPYWLSAWRMWTHPTHS